MRKRLLIVGILLAALLGGLAYFQLVLKPQLIAAAIASAPRPSVAVTSETARSERWETRRASIGSVIAERGIDIASQVAGIVAAIKMDSGQDVAAGAGVVDLDTNVEQADLASAKATLQQAELALWRATDLAQKSVGSIASLDQARAARDTADAAVKRVEALIAQKTIRAPFAGRIGIRKVDKGQYVGAGQALVSLQQLDPIRADFPVPEQDIGSLKIGQTVEVSVDAWPGAVFSGRIAAFDSRVAADTRTLLVRADFPNPEFKLLPGMFASVVVRLGDEHDVVTVPRTAITYSLYGDSVYVIRHDAPPPASAEGSKENVERPAHGAAESGKHAGVKVAETTGGARAAEPGKGADKPPAMVQGLPVERRFIRLGQTRDERVAVLSGLTAGEEVVTSGQVKLHADARVRVDNTEKLVPPAERPRQ